MQVTCLGFNWDEVRKRPNAAAVLEEMIATDDVDAYSTSLPEGMWQFDSATLHFEVAGVLVALRDAAGPEARPPLDAIAELISTGDSIDELGLSTLTDGCYFVTLSPERLDILNEAFARLDRPRRRSSSDISINGVPRFNSPTSEGSVLSRTAGDFQTGTRCG